MQEATQYLGTLLQKTTMASHHGSFHQQLPNSVELQAEVHDFSIEIRAAAMLQIEKKDTRCVHARDFPLPPIIKTRSGGSHPPPLQHGHMKKGAKIVFPQLYVAVAQCAPVHAH